MAVAVLGSVGDEAHDKLVKAIVEQFEFYGKQLDPIKNAMSRYTRLYLGERKDSRRENEKWRSNTWLGDPFHQTETEVAVWLSILNSQVPSVTAEVPFAGKKNGDEDLRVLLRQLQDGPLQIQAIIGILPHSVQMLVLLGIKGQFQLKMVAALAFELPGKMSMMLMSGFLEQDLALLIQISHTAVLSLDYGPDLAVLDDRYFFADRDLGADDGLWQQRPAFIRDPHAP